MLLARKQKQIPERLSHYTNMVSLKSILSDKEGKGICLWAFSNKHNYCPVNFHQSESWLSSSGF